LRFANGRTTIALNARAAENGPQTCGSSRKKNKMASVGNSRDHWHSAAVTAQYAKGLCPICHNQGSRSRVVANLPNFENQFLHQWICYSTDCRFEMADF
jgi:hypothetical protein